MSNDINPWGDNPFERPKEAPTKEEFEAEFNPQWECPRTREEFLAKHPQRPEVDQCATLAADNPLKATFVKVSEYLEDHPPHEDSYAITSRMMAEMSKRTISLTAPEIHNPHLTAMAVDHEKRELVMAMEHVMHLIEQDQYANEGNVSGLHYHLHMALNMMHDIQRPQSVIEGEAFRARQEAFAQAVSAPYGAPEANFAGFDFVSNGGDTVEFRRPSPFNEDLSDTEVSDTPQAKVTGFDLASGDGETVTLRRKSAFPEIPSMPRPDIGRGLTKPIFTTDAPEINEVEDTLTLDRLREVTRQLESNKVDAPDIGRRLIKNPVMVVCDDVRFIESPLLEDEVLPTNAGLFSALDK